MSDFDVKAPVNQTTPDLRKPLAPKKLSKISPEQRQWASNVLKALGLSPKSSQHRLLAGAFASAEVIDQTGSPQDKKRAAELRKKLGGVGTKPFDTETAMLVGSAKVELDILSIPPNDRALKKGPGGGVNSSFWIDRKDADGQDRHSFLCKPANLDAINAPASGGPLGGEVAREALASRTANFLNASTGVDIGMLETHVVKVPAQMMGGEGGDLTCSVQEARPSKGPLGEQATRPKVDDDQVAGLAVFDMLSLNVDRHSGNFLVGEDNALIPIDHGESFVEPSEQGNERVKNAMGGPHNALLSLPSAHKPMSKEMIKSLSALDPAAYAKMLGGDRKAIEKQHPDMAGMVSDGAIETARRSALFLKFAVRSKPPMSPATMQVAMANAADELFGPPMDDNAFQQVALAVIDRFGAHGDTIKNVCTAPGPEYAKLVKQAADLGWQVATRGGAPEGPMITDPIVLMQIVKGKIAAPPGNVNKQVKAAKDLALIPVSQDEMLDTILLNRLAIIDDGLRLLPNAEQVKIAKRKQDALRPGYSTDKQLGFLDGLLREVLRDACNMLSQRLDLVAQQGPVEAISDQKLTDPPYMAYGNARAELAKADPFKAKVQIDLVENRINDGSLVADACTAVTRRLRRFVNAAELPTSTPLVKTVLQLLGNLDPVAANDALTRLKATAVDPNRKQAALDKIQRQLDDLAKDYLIDPTSDYVLKTKKALESGDVEAADQAIEYVMNGALSGPPALARMQAMAKMFEIPTDDEDFKAALAGAQQNDARATRGPWERIKVRIKKGELGARATLTVKKRLDDLTDAFEIPRDHPWLARAVSALNEKKLEDAIYYWGRLNAQTEAGMFEAKRG